MGILDDLRQSVIDGDMNRTQELVAKAIAEKVPAEQILKEGLISAMAEVGRMFECGDFFVPEMLIAARAMKSGLTLLRPHLIAAKVQAVGKVVIGTAARRPARHRQESGRNDAGRCRLRSDRPGR